MSTPATFVTLGCAALVLMVAMLHLLRRADRAQPDEAWQKAFRGIKPAERHWDVSRDHDHERANPQLRAELAAQKRQAELKKVTGKKAPADVLPMPRRKGGSR